MEEFNFDSPFDSSSLTHFRKRCELISTKTSESIEDVGTSSHQTVNGENLDGLIADAIAVPVEITYPTDARRKYKTRGYN